MGRSLSGLLGFIAQSYLVYGINKAYGSTYTRAQAIATPPVNDKPGQYATTYLYQYIRNV